MKGKGATSQRTTKERTGGQTRGRGHAVQDDVGRLRQCRQGRPRFRRHLDEVLPQILPAGRWFIEANYPKHKDEAQDVFQRVAARIAHSPEITNHDFKDKFRTVVIKLCRRELDRMHPKNRQEAERRFHDQPFHVLASFLFPALQRKDPAERKMEDIIDSIREELLDPNFDNARYLAQLNVKYLNMWRTVQMSDTKNMAEIARRLGLERYEVERPWKIIERWIGDEAKRIVKALGYLN